MINIQSQTLQPRHMVAPGVFEGIVAELERRIELLEQIDESIPGRFTLWDWLLCVLGAVIVPYLALWWFAG